MGTRSSEEMEGNLMQLLLLRFENCVDLKRWGKEKSICQVKF